MNKNLVWLLTALLFFLNEAGAKQYFVSTDGNNENNGMSESMAWLTISYAAGQVSPGDTVYIKAGHYGAENVVMSVDGTADNPIVFAGYTASPGDNPDTGWNYPDNIDFDSSIMPLLDGGDRSTGTGIALNMRQYVTVKNFQVQNYEIGVYGYQAEHVSVENIITKNMGDINADYSGNGIVFGSLANHNIIKNCISLNAAVEGINIIGDHNIIENCQVYCDDNSTGLRSNTDYYIVINGNHNTVTDSYAERVGDLDHDGHGIGVKGDCKYNVVKNSTANNFSGGFYVRHRGSKYNLFENCTALDSGVGFLVRDGASENTFSRCRTVGGTNAVAFMDTSEDGGAQSAGSKNLFENCIFEKAATMISFHHYDRNSDTYDNSFINCTFYDGEYLFSVERDNHDNYLINSIVSNVQNFTRGGHDLNFSFSYSLFGNNGFAIPTGFNVLLADPLFLNAPGGDYHLTPASPCVDAGITEGAPEEDYDKVTRPKGSGHDIGAYEYTGLSLAHLFLLLAGD